MIQDPQLQSAVSRIMQRSERQTDSSKLVSTYVDVGLLSQLQNRNHQIFYGRRGTGKTHVMKVLETEFQKDESITVVYLDCRTLGSTSQFADLTLPMSRRCLALFRDFLLAIHEAIVEHIVSFPSEQYALAHEEIEALASLITDPLTTMRANRHQTEVSDSSSLKDGTNFGFGTKDLVFDAKVGVNANRSKDTSQRSNTDYTVENEDKIVFPDLHRQLKRVLKLAESSLVILIDEWSSLPGDVQPYLAEFLKRGVIPLNEATIKISALEYRCKFSFQTTNGYIGLELGADIATAPDLDDYYVFDRNPVQITNIYADVLYRHLSSELEEGYLGTNFQIHSGSQLAESLFTERTTCDELARACEGVVRDLINIFTKAFFDSLRRGRKTIDKSAVVNSARQWFEQDKTKYLDDELVTVLQTIVSDVIGRRRARSFLLASELERHPVIQRLFDARVIHHLQRGYADKDNPGLRYNIYTIDYGTYVNLIGTSKQPELDLFSPEDRAEFINDETDFVVPFDDKRSIRRIILGREVLDA